MRAARPRPVDLERALPEAPWRRGPARGPGGGRGARLAKSAAFEDTPTWKAISAAFEAKLGRPPAEAILPRVDLVSPKFTRPLTTQWFAENTQRRYAACRARAR